MEARGLLRRLRGPARDVLTVRGVGPGALALDRLDAAGATAVLVTGLAGGCAPDLAPGDLVIGDPVTRAGTAGPGHRPDGDLRTRALRAAGRAGLRPHVGPLATADDLVPTPTAKAALWRADGALAVDMESAPVLAWAARAGLPAVAVRAIADGAGEGIPRELLAALAPDGRVRAAGALALARRPSLAGAAWRLGRRSRRALDALGRFLQAFVDRAVEP